MQTIMSTFQAYRLPSLSGNIFDPLSNIVASMRYALSRYGSLSAAYNKAGGYALGGVFNPNTLAYDNGGGLPPGFTMAYNGTRKTEQVFTAGQLAAMAERQATAELLDIDVYVGNQQITDIARIEVKRHVGAQSRALPGRRTTVR
jgi:SLT domain-containing protein